MATKKMKTYTLADMKNEFIGKIGTPEREEYEYELQMEVLGKMVRAARKERHLTQEQLGKLVGVKKAQISKLDRKSTRLNSSHVAISYAVFCLKKKKKKK